MNLSMYKVHARSKCMYMSTQKAYTQNTTQVTSLCAARDIAVSRHQSTATFNMRLHIATAVCILFTIFASNAQIELKSLKYIRFLGTN